MTIIIWILLALLGLKLIWNLGVPFVLLKRLWADPKEPPSGISMSTLVEVALLVLATIAAALSGGSGYLSQPLFILLWGSIAIVVTYIHIAVVGALGGWFISHRADG